MTHTAAAPDTGLRSAVHAWVDGWARARGTEAPQAVPGGFRIEVRRPGHLARHVLPEAEPAVLRDLVDTLTTPGLWIKACAPREVVEPLLTADWEISEPQYLMTTDRLAASRSGAGLPSGYRLEIVDEGGTSTRGEDGAGQLPRPVRPVRRLRHDRHRARAPAARAGPGGHGRAGGPCGGTGRAAGRVGGQPGRPCALRGHGLAAPVPGHRRRPYGVNGRGLRYRRP
nr:hypothetical protein [Streptomyces sp. WAC01526]